MMLTKKLPAVVKTPMFIPLKFHQALGSAQNLQKIQMLLKLLRLELLSQLFDQKMDGRMFHTPVILHQLIIRVKRKKAILKIVF